MDEQPADIRDVFPGWFDDDADRRAYFERALVTLDANILLALYRISPKARRELLSILAKMGDRLWVPHQASLEFVRSRAEVIANRNKKFSDVNQSLRNSCDKAAAELFSAIDSLKGLRSSVVAFGSWSESDHGLAHDEIKQRLKDMMQPALEEFGRLKEEQDLSPQDLREQDDPVMRELRPLLQGRVGPRYPAPKLHSLIEHAISFRYPNDIPPGYLDLKTKLPARAAGDFILWSQLIDHARLLGPTRDMVILITNDAKPDWWELDRRSNPVVPRRELVQEFYEESAAKLLVLRLDQFLEGSRSYLAEDVSPETVEEARDVVSEDQAAVSQPDFVEGRPLQELGHHELLRFVTAVFSSMGHKVFVSPGSSIADLILERDGKRSAVRVKMANVVLPVEVSRLAEAIRVTGADRGAIVTTGTFSQAAQIAARNSPMQMVLVDGEYLQRLSGGIFPPHSEGEKE